MRNTSDRMREWMETSMLEWAFHVYNQWRLQTCFGRTVQTHIRMQVLDYFIERAWCMGAAVPSGRA